MIGSVIGDLTGSTYEFKPTKDYNFEFMPNGSEITDDSIMSLAIAEAIMRNQPYAERMRYWGRKYPNPKGAYGGSFSAWLASPTPQPYNSFGNGSAMRVGAIGWAFNSLEEVQMEAYKSAECTHNHTEGIKGAVATATAIFMARKRCSKEEIKQKIEQQFSYDLGFTLDEIRPTYRFNESCMETVPQAIKCYIESKDFEDAVRLAVSLGGDADTLGCITGGIAEAGYGTENMPTEFMQAALMALPADLHDILIRFYQRFV